MRVFCTSETVLQIHLEVQSTEKTTCFYNDVGVLLKSLRSRVLHGVGLVRCKDKSCAHGKIVLDKQRRAFKGMCEM